MRGQLLRRQRPGMAGKVRRRPNHQPAQIGTDADRDHVLGDPFAQSDTGVKTLGDDIGQAMVHAHFNVDVRIIR